MGPRSILHEAQAAAAVGFAWWIGELGRMLPGRLRRAPEGAGLEVEPVGTALRIGRMTASGWEPDDEGQGPRMKSAGALRPGRLRLPPDRTLARLVTLPAAVAENLREALAFQLDRFTPFELGEVYLGCRIVDRDPDAEAIQVALAVAPREEVDALLAQARERGVACAAVIAQTDLPGGELSLEVGGEDNQQAGGPGGWVRRAVWVAVALLAIADIAVPLLQDRATLMRLQDEVAVARREAVAVAALREEVEMVSEQTGFARRRWQATNSMVGMLTELTRLLPDSAWITQMQADQSTVQLTGFADSANALIPLLEASSMFGNAEFRSPVTQDAAHGLEQFHVSIRMRRRGDG